MNRLLRCGHLYSPAALEGLDGRKRRSTVTPSAMASRSMLSTEMFLAPRSTWATKVRCRLAANANASWLSPRSCLSVITLTARISRAATRCTLGLGDLDTAK